MDSMRGRGSRNHLTPRLVIVEAKNIDEGIKIGPRGINDTKPNNHTIPSPLGSCPRVRLNNSNSADSDSIIIGVGQGHCSCQLYSMQSRP